MTRLRLLNKFRQHRTISSHAAYKIKAAKYVLNYYKKTKKELFKNLDVKRVTGNKQYWKTVRPCLTNKTSTDERITLIENEKVASGGRDLKSLMNTFQILHQTSKIFNAHQTLPATMTRC